jgi:hypothetical protein
MTSRVSTASVVGFGAYVLGRTVLQVTGPLGIGLVVAGVAFVVGVVLFVRSNEAELEARAEQGAARTIASCASGSDVNALSEGCSMPREWDEMRGVPTTIARYRRA